VPNEKNLVPINQRPKSEQRKIQSAGGVASGAARRRKRALKEAADLYLSLPVADKRRLTRLERDGIDPEDIDHQMAIVAGLSTAAEKGDAAAARVLVQILGEDAKADPAADQLARAAAILGGIDGIIE